MSMGCLLFASLVCVILHQVAAQCNTALSTNYFTLDGRQCCFPFAYKGHIFYTCTQFDYHRMWCSTTSNYQGSWGNCLYYPSQVTEAPKTAAPGAAGTTQLVLPCRYEYTVVQSTNSLGGSRVQGKYTPMDCQNFCDMEPMCVGFDMDFIGIPASCWWHSSVSFSKRNNGTSPGVAQYTKTGRCNPNYIQQNQCFSIMRADTHSDEGQQFSGTNSVEECMNACSQRTGCVGLDFNTGDNSCYLHWSITTFRNTQKAMSGVNQYEKTC